MTSPLPVTQARNLRYIFSLFFFYFWNVSWNLSYFLLCFAWSTLPHPSDLTLDNISTGRESHLLTTLPLIPYTYQILFKSLSYIIFKFILVIAFTMLHYNCLFYLDTSLCCSHVFWETNSLRRTMQIVECSLLYRQTQGSLLLAKDPNQFLWKPYIP